MQPQEATNEGEGGEQTHNDDLQPQPEVTEGQDAPPADGDVTSPTLHEAAEDVYKDIFHNRDEEAGARSPSPAEDADHSRKRTAYEGATEEEEPSAKRGRVEGEDPQAQQPSAAPAVDPATVHPPSTFSFGPPTIGPQPQPASQAQAQSFQPLTSTSFVSPTEAVQQQQQQVSPAANAAQFQIPVTMGGLPNPANKKQRELYAGNLMVGVVNEAILKDFFTQLFNQLPEFRMKYAQMQCQLIQRAQPHPDGKFAFVEFADETLAATAMRFNRIPLCGRPILLQPPTGVTPTTAQPLDVTPLVQGGIIVVTGAAATSLSPATKKLRDLYVGNLPDGTLAPDLQNQISAHMRIQPDYNPADGNPVIAVNLNGKYAFVEFCSPEMATKALTILDKSFFFNGRKVRVQRPTGYQEPGTEQVTTASAAANSLLMQQMQQQNAILAAYASNPAYAAMLGLGGGGGMDVAALQQQQQLAMLQQMQQLQQLQQLQQMQQLQQQQQLLAQQGFDPSALAGGWPQGGGGGWPGQF